MYSPKFTFLQIFLCINIGSSGCSRQKSQTSSQPPASFSQHNWNAEEQKRIAAVQPYVTTAAREYNLEPSLINGLIWVESRFDSKAQGGGARGLMQLMPATARDLAKKLGVRAKPYDPEFNIRAGSYYLAQMIRSFDGNTSFGLAAYNAGSGTVRKWLKTQGRLAERGQKFVDQVLAAQKKFTVR